MKTTPRNLLGAITERNVLKTIARLPNSPRTLLPLVASWNDYKSSSIVTPWCAGKDLSSLLVDGKTLYGAECGWSKILYGSIVTAVEALHGLKIVHRAEGNVVLGDFGLARSCEGLEMFGDNEPEHVSFDVDPEASSRSFLQPIHRCGIPSWMTPAQQAGAPYSLDADLLVLGALMYKISAGRMPYDRNSSSSPRRRIC
ncbi:kinase-like domain-containing protein [Roridomyces roridus]|uniref:Kinase-like domain-containing protein n=1 Tax=Roridomyces roridus TaxID=1738132 RepID=A0AAD7C5Z8_9AGAR|nr:kinase-like domain-containing protein [Roridomyces roridus]